MNSHFKFPRRVRIHGGECGAVARALHHEVKGFSLYQADSGKALGSTIERKSMSTKTSLLKRISQTAVVALVTGLLSFVTVPASNAQQDPSISGTCVARAGVGGILNITATGSVGRTTGLSLGTQIVAKEIARTAVSGAAAGTTALQTGLINSGYTETGTSGLVLPISGESLTAGLATVTYSVWTNSSNNSDDASAPGALSASTTVTCTVAGAPATFSLSSTTGSVGAGETATFTITPKDAAGNNTLFSTQYKGGNTVNSMETFTVTANSAQTDNFVYMSPGKQNVRATWDAAARAGASYISAGHAIRRAATAVSVANVLNSNENQPLALKLQGALTASGNSNRLSLDARFADTATTGAPTAATPGADLVDFSGDTLTATGAFTMNVAVSGAGTTTFTIAGGAGTSGMTSATYTLTTQSFGYAGRISFSSQAAASTAYKGVGIFNSTAVEHTLPAGDLTAPSIGTALTASKTYYLSTVTGKTVNLKLHTGSSTGTVPVTVAAVTGYSLPTGITAATTNYTSVARTDGTETSTTVTLTATAPVIGDAYKVTYNSSANNPVTLTFIYEAPVVGANSVGARGTATLSPVAGTTYKNVVSGTNNIEATVTDQFADVVSGATVRAVVTGRNPQTLTYTTDVNGVAKISWTDAGAVLTGSGLTGTTDGVSVTAQTSSSASTTTAASYTITYSATLTATTMTLTNNAASTGAAVDANITFTATVLDASGVALAGYPVVFTGNNNTFFSSLSNTITAYTGTNGVATAVFQGKTIGTGTVTATSGGKSATSSYTILAGGARTIAVDAATVAMAPGESKRVTATVKDSYGNVVEDQAVTVTYVGTAGRVASVNGVTSATGDTDADGKVVIELLSEVAGTGTLTVSFTGGSTSTLTNDDGSARPTRVASVTSAITISGTNAGIAATNAATAAAEAAGDAAAEAIDAANAATDAANLAAEAADAATVAAEEARDAADAATAAVEELATQVATLMAALKAQITTLANTVAKIAKKVKA
jgi:hypothetical protein